MMNRKTRYAAPALMALALTSVLGAACSKSAHPEKAPPPSQTPAPAPGPAPAPRPAEVPQDLPTRVQGLWRILTLDGAPLRRLGGADPASGVSLAPNISFSPTRVGIYSGCNSGGGDIAWSGTTVRFSADVLSTLIGCGDLRDQEDAIFGLFKGATVTLDGEILTLRSADHVLTLTR